MLYIEWRVDSMLKSQIADTLEICSKSRIADKLEIVQVTR